MKKLPFSTVLFGLLFSFLFNRDLPAQVSAFSFEKLTIDDGLSQSTVTVIFQDSKGFLWFGTANGLNKYDGYTFTVYKHEPADSNTLSSDMINAITEDKNGMLWIGTEDGLNKFDPGKEQMTRFANIPEDSNSLSSNKIYSLAADDSGNIWIGTLGGGLNKYDHVSKKFRNYSYDPEYIHESSYDYIRRICLDKKGNLWLATVGGLALFNPQSLKFRNFKKSFQTQNPDLREEIYALGIDKDSTLWFGTDGSLNNYNPVSGKLISFISGDKTVNSFFRIWSMLNDSKDNIWLGTGGNGVHIFNKKEHTFKIIRNDPAKPSSLSENSIMSLFEDRGGVVWFGTSTSGVNKYTGNKNKFKYFKHDPENPNTISSDIVYGMTADKYGTLWVGTTDGLNRIDKLGKVTQYQYKANCSTCLSSNIITDLSEDKEGNIWIATRWGLSKFDRKRNNFKVYKADTKKNNWLYSNNLSEVYADSDGIIWIGTFNQGFEKLDPGKEIFTHYTAGNGTWKISPGSTVYGSLTSNRIIAISDDNRGNLLIGTDKGLNIFNKKSGTVVKTYRYGSGKESLSSDNILGIYSDDEGIIWIGTNGGGLDRLNRTTGEVICFSEARGLPNNVVYGIVPDNSGNLWLSTNKGLVRFNKKTFRVRIYDPSDGLQSFEFNSDAYCRSRDGELFFGGVNGFNSFYPEQVKDNPITPTVLITSVKILHKEIIKANAAGLSYNENFISFEFVSLDFASPKKNKYLYKLEGFDKEWIESGNRRFADYTNLEPGEYTFRVKGSNSDEVWNETGASFGFTIYPPFWRTWWFYVLSAIAVTGLIVFIYKYRLRLKMNQLFEIEKMRKKIADDFHDQLGHKLTKISLYSELMRKDVNGNSNDGENYLLKINEAANTLFDDTKDFIWSLDPVKDSLYDLAVYLKDFGDEFFDKTGIAFRVSEISDTLSEIILSMDWKRQLILIFKEAMNNCLRHSCCKNVELSVTVNQDKIEINLRDDGKGFIGNNGSKGRGINNMNDRAIKIGGQILIESLQNKGTTIRFSGEKEE